MFRYLFRIAGRAAKIKRMRFISLTLTIAAASALLVILSTVYFNAESQLSMDMSGIPNMVVQPGRDLLNTEQLYTEDVKTLKAKHHFWRNNVLNAVPVLESKAATGGNVVNIAGTWFDHNISVDDETYAFGLLQFDGWSYRGKKPSAGSVVVGSRVGVENHIKLEIEGEEQVFEVAGVLETGSFWDDYIFMDIESLKQLTGRETIDKILVSALIKPKDAIARKAEQFGIEGLNPEQFEKWSCSPYAGSIAYSIEKVLPKKNVRILRRITEVQGSVIKASTGIFLALFILTMASSLTAIISAEKMYVNSHLRDFGIMTAIGGSRKKIYLQLLVELLFAAFLSAILTYGISLGLLNYVSYAVFNIDFSSYQMLLITSLVMPLVISLTALLFVQKGLTGKTIELLG